MKKYIFKFLLGFSLLVGPGLMAQSSVCAFTTCVPGIGFTNTNDMQIYAAILASRSGTAVISSGSVVVTNTVPVVVTNTAPVQVTNTVTITGQITNTVAVTGQVGGYSTKKHYTLPTSTVAYSAGDCVGGDVAIDNLRRASGKPYIVYEIAFFDSSGHTPDLNVTFLSIPYSVNTDNSPTQFTNDQTRYLGDVSIASADWVTTGITSRVCSRYVGIICDGIELYAVVTTNTAMSLPSRTCFVMKLGALQD